MRVDANFSDRNSQKIMRDSAINSRFTTARTGGKNLDSETPVAQPVVNGDRDFGVLRNFLSSKVGSEILQSHLKHQNQNYREGAKGLMKANFSGKLAEQRDKRKKLATPRYCGLDLG